MSDNVFVDTNIFVYSRDKGAGQKQVKSESLIMSLWESRRGRISVQVLNEYFVTVTQKLKPGLSHDEAWSDITSLKAWSPLALDWQLLERGRHVLQKHKLSWWDSLVIAAAQASNCRVLYSEDLTNGHVYGGVRVINPFKA